jgi:hypothetical protein
VLTATPTGRPTACLAQFCKIYISYINIILDSTAKGHVQVKPRRPVNPHPTESMLLISPDVIHCCQYDHTDTLFSLSANLNSTMIIRRTRSPWQPGGMLRLSTVSMSRDGHKSDGGSPSQLEPGGGPGSCSDLRDPTDGLSHESPAASLSPGDDMIMMTNPSRRAQSASP